MPIKLTRSVDDPIVMFAIEGQQDNESLIEIVREANQLLAEMGTFYAIVDMREVEITFGEVVAFFEVPGLTNVLNDPRVKPVLVRDSMPPDPTIPEDTPIFADQDQAFDFVRRTIANNAPSQS